MKDKKSKRKAVLVKPVNNKMTKKKKDDTITEVKKRSAVGYAYCNGLLSCTCIAGKCPNYNEQNCGQGGRAVYRQHSRKLLGREIKRMLYRDQNITPWK